MIKSLSLKGYSCHKDLTVDFQKGLNAVIGKNRAGKSSIMEAICYSLYGKTQNSTIDKIINFESDKAVVSLTAENYSVVRTRTKKQSKLDGITKEVLEQNLNLSYQEFLSIFYISSHEQKSLFDPSYFRNFLISLFNLEIYSKIYDRLGAEYQGLQAAIQNYKQVNLPLIQQRYTRVHNTYSKLSQEREGVCQRRSKYEQALNQLSQKNGEVRGVWNQITKKEYLLNKSQCTECGRPITPEYKAESQQKINVAKSKVQAVTKQIQEQTAKILKERETFDKQLSYIDSRITKSRILLSRLQEKAKQQGPQVNVTRIKELEQLMPVFNSKGFPSYLLQVYLPVIISTTNNLLQMMFPDMRVSIRTERPESNRPDFKVLINKGEEVQEIADLCGAERVLVNLCFRLGIMVIFKQLSKTGIDFMLVDEGLEKVDDQNSIAILKLFENFIQMGYLSQVILVTHKTILKQQENVHYIEL